MTNPKKLHLKMKQPLLWFGVRKLCLRPKAELLDSRMDSHLGSRDGIRDIVNKTIELPRLFMTVPPFHIHVRNP